MRVRLETFDGGLVVERDIPPFVARPPEAILWGGRTFLLRQRERPMEAVREEELPLAYSEGFLYVIPPCVYCLGTGPDERPGGNGTCDVCRGAGI